MKTLEAVPMLLPMEAYQLLSEIAHKKQRTFSDVLSQALTQFIEKELGPKALQAIAKQ